MRLQSYFSAMALLVALPLLGLSCPRPERCEGPAGEAAGRHPGITVLMYHHLVTCRRGFEGNDAVLAVEQFREQMRSLARAGYRTLDAQGLLDYLAGRPAPANTVVITFDDGYESNYTYAYPILKEYGLTAIIHIVVAMRPGEVGAGRARLPHLSWDQIRRMVASGTIDIQSHTFDSHYHVGVDATGAKGPKLSAKMWLARAGRLETPEEYEARIAADLQLSEQLIERRLGNDVIAIAYPFGAHNPLVRQVINQRTGIRLGFTIQPGQVRPGDDPLQLSRVNVSPGWTVSEFMEAVRGSPGAPAAAPGAAVPADDEVRPAPAAPRGPDAAAQ